MIEEIQQKQYYILATGRINSLIEGIISQFYILEGSRPGKKGQSFSRFLHTLVLKKLLLIAFQNERKKKLISIQKLYVILI